MALSDNFIKVALASPRPPNQLIDVAVDGVTPTGVREAALLSIAPMCSGL
jgi:hypothetical protein